jgi:hypothetical protein
MFLCERFTKFALAQGLIEESMINIPQNAFVKK